MNITKSLSNIENLPANSILTVANKLLEHVDNPEISNNLPIVTISYAQTLDGSM